MIKGAVEIMVQAVISLTITPNPPYICSQVKQKGLI